MKVQNQHFLVITVHNFDMLKTNRNSQKISVKLCNKALKLSHKVTKIWSRAIIYILIVLTNL